ncbi:ABC transporter ATP-binding protein [Hoeflea olei]|uniref:ABC transporter ATP-binding protein n=1 Tax=Hoeflea olei TaxID=1480615 RepID=A0A1C1YV87_9HYPH|nr:ABC transporter ATP-binding protein [Hoeflea olei]
MNGADEQDAIAVAGIEKTYGWGGRAFKALDGLSLGVPQGCVYGLLGPNGAGKSTLLRIIAGLVRADRGSVSIFGATASRQSRRRLGMLIEAPAFYPFLTAREHLEMVARTSDSDTNARVEPVLRRVGIGHAADRKVAAFSLGMKQRLGIGCALVAHPDAIVLDEPTNGLDPDGILEMRSLIAELARRDGITVLLSSHLLDEVERVCDRVAILRDGRLAAQGRVADLLDGQARFWLSVDCPQLVLERLAGRADAGDGGVYVRIGREQAPELIRMLSAADIRIFEAKWVKPDLESVFLSETRKAAP